jgi:hypothetical protein
MEPEAGYHKAKHMLKQRFGNDYLIAEAWINKVTEGKSIKATERTKSVWRTAEHILLMLLSL